MIKSIVLDISKNLSTPTQTIVLRQGDMNSLTLNIAINEDGLAFDLANYEARFMARTLDRKVVIEPCEKTGANMLSYTLPTALAAKPGTVTLSYVAIMRNGEWVASTEAMTFYVLPGVDIDAEEAENILSEFIALKAKVDAMVEELIDQQTAQQSSWEEQMESQAEAFAEGEEKRDAALQEALGSLGEVDIDSITIDEINDYWADSWIKE